MDFAAPTASLFASLGVAATHLATGGEASVTVLVRKDLHRDPLAFSEPIRTDQVVLEMLTSEAGAVARGDVLRVGGVEYQVDRVDLGDELITRLICSDRSG
jgi:hypothetical protein